ncbi:GntR family transcriptional regulator [Bremerella cremea]|uniref:GntR family transcriptional regulator n=1 Tax=Bremerella cremea TaxID=1031537 RepID=A0A368KV26_9BACT|nr:GntR family transcriptional regulator [Bremerella cremea]RCS54280.1 GntR family transcriptional regulator [Bremerella cremea]
MDANSLTDAPISRTSLTDSVYQKLLSAILRRELKEGAELTTVSLAKQLGVSRTPVQEALNRLAADGLVTCETGRRAQVARFSREDVTEIYSLRKLLEGEAAARAATRLSREEVAEMQGALEALLTAAAEFAYSDAGQDQWCQEALNQDTHFHDQLAIACGNRRMAEDIRRYRLLVRSFCRLVGSVENLTQAISEHLKILNAIASQSPDEARAAMIDHIERRQTSVIQELFPEQ